MSGYWSDPQRTFGIPLFIGVVHYFTLQCNASVTVSEGSVKVKIRHFLYNAFLIEEGNAKVAIDPGQNLALFKLETLIPQSEWASITHIVVTHGDPDHYWQADRIAEASNAHFICGDGLSKIQNGKAWVVDPRGRGLTSWIALDNVTVLDVGERVTLDGIGFKGIKTKHGALAIPIFGFTFERKPGPGERIGLGAMGFEIGLGGKTLVNLGDTMIRTEWKGLNPDVLMIPIGGLVTMDVPEALEAVRLISPKMVIPCHYNVPFLWIGKAAPANDERFKREVEDMGVECRILGAGDQIVL
jgi:L-ascorbate metabolism protein UlaG (beta-lactamase superfamily)